MTQETKTVAEIRKAYEARQTMLERIKNGDVQQDEIDTLDMLFKMNAAEYVAAMLKHYDALEAENARLREALRAIASDNNWQLDHMANHKRLVWQHVLDPRTMIENVLDGLAFDEMSAEERDALKGTTNEND